ncbi:hypothetical protein QK388_02390 [Pseudomonas aeruginosa]|nr:hypothetical protein [Pseudomonas aeruginosa]MDI4006089.1 hypothetical protein [Pseudomonas aeruginosa]
MSKELNKAPVEQAGGDERAAFEAYRDRRNALLESEGCKPGSKWHITNAHYPTWKASRAALAQPSGEVVVTKNESGAIVSVTRQDKEGRLLSVIAESQPSPAQAEQAEAERPEVVARVVHSNPVVLGQCGPLNANDELMTVAQHAASVARWAEMFNRVEQQRDAALVEVERLRESKGDPVGSLEKCMKVMYERDEHAKRLEAALARVAELEACGAPALLAAADYFAERAKGPSPGWVTLSAVAKELRVRADKAPVAQAQHSVPEGWKLVPVEPTEDVLEAIHNGGYVGDDQELRWFYQSILAAAPGKEVGHE